MKNIIAIKEKQREERKIQKPWRENMKSADSLDNQTENTNEKIDITNKDDKCHEDSQNRKSDPLLAKTTDPDDIRIAKNDVEPNAAKPWRQHMKRLSGSQNDGKGTYLLVQDGVASGAKINYSY